MNDKEHVRLLYKKVAYNMAVTIIKDVINDIPFFTSVVYKMGWSKPKLEKIDPCFINVPDSQLMS